MSTIAVIVIVFVLVCIYEAINDVAKAINNVYAELARDRQDREDARRRDKAGS